MATFNAGAIEATLTLDRSPFTREMRAAQAQARRMTERKISPKLELDGREALAEAEAMLKAIGDERVTVEFDIDGAGELAALEMLVKGIDNQDIDFQVEIHGIEKLVALEGLVKAMDGQDIDLDVDPRGGVGAAVAGFSRMQAIILGILVILPLLTPVIASLGAAIIAVTAGLVGAGGALGVVGLAVVPTLKGMMDLNEEITKQKTRLDGLEPGTKAYAEQADKIARLQDTMNKRFGEASAGLQYMKEKWDDFTKATEPVAQGLIGQGMRLIGDALTAITPIFEAAAPVISSAFTSISDFLASGEGQEMIDFFAGFGVDALRSFLEIGGNLLRFFGNLFDAFSPFASDFLGSVSEMTAGWADWAASLEDNPQFQEFIDYVAEVGPEVWDLIKNIGGAIVNLGVALAPLGDIALDGFNAFFGYIKDMDPALLGAIAVGLGIAATAILAVAAAMAIFNFVMALNPFVLIAIAVIAVVAALIYLWNTSEGFRDGVIGAWNAIVDVVMGVVSWFQTNVLPPIQAVWDGIVAGVQTMIAIFTPIFQLIQQIVVQAFHNIWIFVGPLVQGLLMAISIAFNGIKNVVMAVWPVIQAIITGALNVIRAVVTTVMNQVKAVWTGAWNAIKIIFTAAIKIVQSILSAVLAFMKGDISGALGFIKNAWSTAWNAMKQLATNAINTVKAVVSAGLNGMKAIFSAIWNAITTVVRTAWNTVKSVVSGGIGAIKGMFSGAGGWLVGAGRSIIQGLINGIKGMIGAVKNAVGNVLSAARNLLPFSPAKEGPFSGRGWTLYSGRAIVGALAQGMKDEVPGLRSQTRAVADAIANDLLPGASEFGLNRGTPQIASAGARGDVNVHVTAVNPLPERSSTTAVREVSRLGQLGVFSG